MKHYCYRMRKVERWIARGAVQGDYTLGELKFIVG
jgi:hypothetical protein